MMGFVYLLKFAVKCLEILAWPVFGLGYPLCASIQAIETNSNSDTQKLISYWVSISVVLLFEHSFQLEWLAFWAYIKLMIVGFLVLPYFDGSLYVYKHIVNPCLSTGPRIITSQFNKRKELFFKKDDFLVEVKRYMKENGSDALEDLIASTKKSAKPNVAEIKALAAEDWPKFEQPKLPVQFKDSNTVEITEKIEVASTQQLLLEQPKLPVRSNGVEITEKKEVASITQLKVEQPKLPVQFSDSNDAEITEKKEVASTKQVRQIESNISQTESRTFPPLENIKTATTTVGGRDLCEMLPPEKVQKVWTCVVCQLTAQSETVLNSHLQGRRHKAACEQLKVKNQTPKREVSPVSAGKKSNITTTTAGIGVTCVVCQPKFEQPKLPVQFKDGNAAEMTEKIEVASTKQLKLEQPKLPVRSNGVEITEKKEVASTTQLKFEQPKLPALFRNSIDVKMTEEKVREIEAHIRQTEESRTFPPPENISTATTAVGGRDLCEMLPLEKVQKVWTCVICQVTAQSETVFNSHIQGRRHKAAFERLKVKSETPKGEVSPESAGNKSNVTTWIGVTCVVCEVKLKSQDDFNSHLLGKKHKKACERLNSKNQASNDNVSPVSAGNKSNVTTCIGVTCVVCEVKLNCQSAVNSHLQGKKHKKACERLHSKIQASNENVSPASDAKKANFPESKPGKCTINNSTPPESSIHAAEKQG